MAMAALSISENDNKENISPFSSKTLLSLLPKSSSSTKSQDQRNLFKTLPISFSLKSLLLCLHPMLQIRFLPKLWYTNRNGERGKLEMGTNQIA
ncbi:hypothetical protein J1N35_031115 [Gossypium stocksii]|uniref:Uncharacterized protein n=1 Tax=Gossypium stocksii TaxID=47602 RepID=A0A9D3ZUJ3_9ROSI|nr:hypothetical protein J1N35_031115 [Gossypium stocksii]